MMKKVPFLVILTVAAWLWIGSPSPVSGAIHDVERETDSIETSFRLFSWYGGAYYSAAFFGIPFHGTLYPGVPHVMDVPDTIRVALEIVYVDAAQFTLAYTILLGGMVLYEGVDSYPHGLYSIYYDPSNLTPVRWGYDFNVVWYNGPGRVRLWSIWPAAATWSLGEVLASQASGTSDLSFTIPDWLVVDARVAEFGATTNTFDFTVELPWATRQGRQSLPFGFFTVAYQALTDVAFEVAGRGCPMAHCDTAMSDNANMPVPTGEDTRILWHDEIPGGAKHGLGCCGNGNRAVCSYNRADGDSLVVYDAAGTRLWTSGEHMGGRVWTSAAMIDEKGGVIAVDDLNLVRFLPDGTVKWKTPTPGGVPISPVITANGLIVVVTKLGPVAVYDNVTGHRLGSLYLKDSPGDTEFYETVNTPCVRGNRVYVSTERTNDPAHAGRLWALDIDPANPDGAIEARWSFPFGGPSGASPLRIGDTVYFDGDRLEPGGEFAPHVFAVRDLGDTCELKWSYAMLNSVKASLAKDPRGGIWTFAYLESWLYRLDEETGALVEQVNLDALIGETPRYVPSSVMTLAGDLSDPVMIVGAITFIAGDPSRVVAIDLEAGSLLWKVILADDYLTDATYSQFAIVEDDGGDPVVVFPGSNSGAYGVGAP